MMARCLTLSVKSGRWSVMPVKSAEIPKGAAVPMPVSAASNPTTVSFLNFGISTCKSTEIGNQSISSRSRRWFGILACHWDATARRAELFDVVLSRAVCLQARPVISAMYACQPLVFSKNPSSLLNNRSRIKKKKKNDMPLTKPVYRYKKWLFRIVCLC